MTNYIILALGCFVGCVFWQIRYQGRLYVWHIPFYALAAIVWPVCIFVLVFEKIICSKFWNKRIF